MVFEELSYIPGIGLIVRLAQVTLVIVIAYIAFLILKGILGIKHARKLTEISDKMTLITKKLDTLIKVNKSKK